MNEFENLLEDSHALAKVLNKNLKSLNETEGSIKRKHSFD